MAALRVRDTDQTSAAALPSLDVVAVRTPTPSTNFGRVAAARAAASRHGDSKLSSTLTHDRTAAVSARAASPHAVLIRMTERLLLQHVDKRRKTLALSPKRSSSVSSRLKRIHNFLAFALLRWRRGVDEALLRPTYCSSRISTVVRWLFAPLPGIPRFPPRLSTDCATSFAPLRRRRQMTRA